MRKLLRVLFILAIVGLPLISAVMLADAFVTRAADLTSIEAAHVRNLTRFRPAPPELVFSPYRTAPFEAAKIFGRAPGCADVDTEFISDVARASIHAGIDVKLVAATVAVESSCNSFAISSKGAIGLMQIQAKTWKSKYDFTQVNLLNRRANLRVGSEILADLIQQYGVNDGVRRYNGTGVGCQTCDGQYTAKILVLAGRKR